MVLLLDSQNLAEMRGKSQAMPSPETAVCNWDFLHLTRSASIMSI
jgi:hypothetical protein